MCRMHSAQRSTLYNRERIPCDELSLEFHVRNRVSHFIFNMRTGKWGWISGREKGMANRIPNILPQNYENCLFPWTFNVVPVNVIYFEVDDGESWIFASRFTRSVCFEFEFGPIFTYATNATISMIRIWHHKQFNCCVPTVLVAFAIEFAEFSVFICCWIVISIHRKLWYERTDEHGDDAGE